MGSGRLIVCWDKPVFTQVLNRESAYFASEGSVEALSEQFSVLLCRTKASRAKESKRKKWQETILCKVMWISSLS